ncbi:MalY/PatB family protein [Cytobacillus purgationiresistens]|uniref:cysteine-S-conjugate beta-lyase n=1 Tax=Cytobacillus purgationiresistens TaxID=863449 RepID=A0ABU0AI26_9BACI|nr:MalY/PatB family protein [Cytobacillus purgationiresistens]MDQ0270895.1 cystathionine beta-lyase [Cytobacillus purgationiresistens]
MGKHNFHEKIERANSSSVKWGLTQTMFGEADILPMWVADMDFKPTVEVAEAIQQRMEHGIYGYTFAPLSLSEAIRDWVKTRHDWEITLSSIIYNSGVVPSIAAAIQTYTSEGDAIMIQTPVYTPFFEMIKKNNRTVVSSPLKLEDGRYQMDFDDFENKLKEGVKLFLLCNPHNPSGRVWNENELKKIGYLCHKYNCLILADEIHSDLIFKPNRHVSIASLDEKFADITITCIAPTKTFNLAGLQASALIIPNEELRTQFQDFQGRQGFFNLSIFGLIGMETAYRYGAEWLDELLVYLKNNIDTLNEFVERDIPNISVMEPDGTYLVWIDCRELRLSDEEIQERLIKRGKLGLEPGPKYGPGGEGFVRMNIACPHEVLLDGLARLKKAFV